MTAGSWWIPLEQETRLSQGDILEGATLATLLSPDVPVTKVDLEKARGVWKPSDWTPDGGGYCHLVARGRRTPVVVLTDSCQLDKKENNARVVIAPVAVLLEQAKDPKVREVIMAGGRLPLIPLSDVPRLGDCYADLRSLTTIKREAADLLPRMATMSSTAVAFLQERIVGYFIRQRDRNGDDPVPRPPTKGGGHQSG